MSAQILQFPSRPPAPEHPQHTENRADLVRRAVIALRKAGVTSKFLETFGPLEWYRLRRHVHSTPFSILSREMIRAELRKREQEVEP